MNPFALPTFAWTITLLLGAAAVLPKLPSFLPRSFQKSPHGRWLWQASLGLIMLASAYAMILGAHALWYKEEANSEVWFTSRWALQGLPPLQFELGMDALAAFFLVLMGFFALAVAVYSLAALRATHYRGFEERIAGGYSLFVWGSLMAILAYDVFSLLVVLEIATLAFAALALFKMHIYREGRLEGEPQQRQEARLAPKVYLIISHASSAFLLLGFLLLAVPAHSLSFQALRAQAATGQLPVLWNQMAFWFFLLGLGIRAGLIPAHIWPPLVHPASPIPTHAFSQSMGIKVAVFLMIRVFFQFLQPAPWWGLVIFLLAGLTAFINVWYALASHDLKTALAYHSIENIGIMVAGVGLALYAAAHGSQGPWAPLAGLALVAGLFHLFNHAIFMGLLGLATGAIENLTHGEVRMTRLGGILRVYPWTGMFFLVGSWAIAGLPPFNGFVSEWLTLRANLDMFLTYAMKNPAESVLWRELFLLLVGLLLLIASFALTAFCFYKIAGLTLLGRPREDGWRAQTGDVSWWMRAPMALLAFLALFIGLFPRLLFPIFAQIARSVHESLTPDFPPLVMTWRFTESALTAGWWILVPLAFMVLLLLHIRHRGRKPLAWQGGTGEGSRLWGRPTEVSLTWLIRKQFRHLTPPFLSQRAGSSDRDIPPYLPDHFLLADALQPAARQIVVEGFRYAFNVLIHGTFHLSERFALWMQNGDVRRYMLYIALTYLGVLMLYMIFLYTLFHA